MTSELPNWYVAISLSTNLYTLLAAAFFLVRRPRVLSRSMIARGMALLCVGLIVHSGRNLYHLSVSGVPPVYRSDVDALVALVPAVLVAAAVTCWIVDQVHSRRARGR